MRLKQIKAIAFTIYSLVIDFVARLRTLLRYEVQRSKPNRKAVKTIKIVAQGIYRAVAPVARPAALAMFFTVAAFTGLYAETLDTSSPEALIGSIDYIYGILVIIGGYLSAYIPVLNKIEDGAYRVLALAVIIGIGFVFFGAPILKLAMSYAASTSLYEVVLRLIFKSAKPEE